MRKFYKLSRTEKDKKPRNILVKTIIQGTIGLASYRKNCSFHSRAKNKMFPAKIVEYNVFLATSIFVF